MNTKILSIISIIGVLITIALPPIAQDPAYHRFADQRSFFAISNFLDVVSSLPFALIGLLGILWSGINRKIQCHEGMRLAYLVFFCGVFLVGLGSAYYHLAPDNSTLLWDRLPMAVCFMSFLTIVLGEFVDESLSKKLFIPLLLIGMTSVIYWYWSEVAGNGDLRAYLLVQFLPMLLIPVILSKGRSCFTHGYYFWLVLACYAVAKGFELTDTEVYRLTGLVSGHTMKHLISAIGPLLVIFMLARRKRLRVS